MDEQPDQNEAVPHEEAEEEVQYVYVTLPKDVDPAAVGPGAVLKFEDLGTEKPLLRTADGEAVLVGRYVDTIGSVLLLREQGISAFNAKPNYSVMGHTDKQLQFTKAD